MVTVAWILAALSAVGLAQLSLASQWDGVYTAEQADRGRVAYERHCGGCHGQDMRGVDRVRFSPAQAARTPPLVGAQFASQWNGKSLGDLFERIRTSMPEQNPGSLSSQTIADILALLLQQGRYPAGREELSSVRQELDAIVFLKEKRD
jgi:quinoprotein glucose dehydrogenase